MFSSVELGGRLTFPKITLPSTSWSENPGTVEEVVSRLSLGTSSTYDRCEVPPALLASDTWVTAVSTLTSSSRTGLPWESFGVLVLSGCLMQDGQLRDPPRAKASAQVRLPAWIWSQLHGDARPQTQDLLSELMQKCLYCLFFLISCLFFLRPFSCWDTRGCAERPDAPARGSAAMDVFPLQCQCEPLDRHWAGKGCPSLLLPLWSEALLTCQERGFGRRKRGSHFILLPPWRLVLC